MTRALVGFLTTTLLTAAVAHAEPKLAVFPINATDLSKAKVEMLEDAVATASDDLFSMRILGPAEVRELLPAGQQRAAAQCDNLFCWAKIGSTVDASHVLALKASGVDKNILVSVKLIDVSAKRIQVRHQEPIQNDVLAYLNDVKVVLAKVRKKAPKDLQATGAAASAAAAAKPTPPKPAPKPVPKPAPKPAAKATPMPGYLGLGHRTLDDAGRAEKSLERNYGVVVTRLAAGAAASKAGLKPGDVILKMNGMVVATSNDLKRMLKKLHAGDKAVFTVWRSRKELTLTATLGERPKK